MDIGTFFIILAIIILAPLSYIQAFLIIELPKKFGYLKFFVILLCYIFFWVLNVFLLTEGYVNLLFFLLAPILLQSVGVYLLRTQFITDMREELLIDLIRKLVTKFKKFKVMLLMCVFIIFMLLIGCELFSNKKSIALRLESVRASYTAGELIELKYFLDNNSTDEIIICRYPTTEDMTFTYLSDNKREVKKDFATFDVPTSSKDFVVIKPKESYLITTAQFDKTYFDKPGIWQFQMIQNYNFSGENAGIKGWTGSLKSNKIAITIITGTKGVRQL